MLRVGIMLDSYTSSAWEAKVIEDIQSSGFARVELVLLHNKSAQHASSLKNRLQDWNLALFRLYERWDHGRNSTADDALAPTDVSSRLRGVPSIPVESNRKSPADNPPEDQLAEIRGHNLDVIFRFGSSPLDEKIAGAARYGVWSFHHGDSSKQPGNAPLFAELAEWSPVSGSSLRMVTGALDEGRVVYQSYASTDQVSLYGSRNPVYWKTAEVALRGLSNLHAGGAEYVDSLPAYRDRGGEREGESGAGIRPRDRPPNSLRMILFMRRYLSRWLEARSSPSRSGPRTKWYIAIRPKTAALRFDDASGYRLMPCPKDRFYADPFLFEREGKTFLFFEDFRLGEGRAVISCCELDPDGTPGPPVEVLRRPYHLSYPFVFEHEGEIYMIPETKENRKVELLRATGFPTTWVGEADLLSDIYAVDATIQKLNGRLWMFAGVSNGRYSNSDELCLFSADALRGPWTPHPGNPILSDVRRARPAGQLFYDQGRLIRPSQDCGKAYGYALVFSEIITLTASEYAERTISRIEPDVVTDCVGTHTYNRTERFEVVDRTLPSRW